VNGALPPADAEAPEAKKQKISLKVNGAKVKASDAAVEGGGNGLAADANGPAEDEDEDVRQDGAEDVEKQKEVVHALSRDVREALSIVIQQ
jgi:hypothetical protein